MAKIMSKAVLIAGALLSAAIMLRVDVDGASGSSRDLPNPYQLNLAPGGSQIFSLPACSRLGAHVNARERTIIITCL